MMTRVLCLWIPNWPVQRLQARQLALRERPLVLFAEGHRGQEVVMTHCRRAAVLGVSIGMPLAEAKTLCGRRRGCPEPCFLPCDFEADRAFLARLAWSCDRFSPVIGLEEACHPESLLFDLTGCGGLFGGEDRLARQLQEHAHGQGLQVRIAIARTIGAAWALAHCGTQSESIVIVANDQTAAALHKLPVTALRLPSSLVAQLHEFRLRRIDELLALERDSLPSRFGTQLLRRIDQAEGTLDEPLIPERFPEPIRATWEADVPLQSREELEIVVIRLLEDVLLRLQKQGTAVQELTIQLTSPEHQAQTLSLRCVCPTTDLSHLLELLQLQWERESYPQGLCGVQLTVRQAGRVTMSAGRLWPDEDLDGKHPKLQQLIERLSSRLGREAVLRAVLVADAQPERSFVYQPAITGSNLTQGPPTATAGQPLSRLTRPVWLLPAPVPVNVLSVGVEGPPSWFRWQQEYHVARSWGPERITTGWWREDYIRRDYYHVEAASGQRFWIFRTLPDGDWFLHAVCD